MAQANSSKGNPAHKRMSNQALKARRAASWSNHRQTAAVRDAAQDAAKKRNKDLLAKQEAARLNGWRVTDDMLTPWQQAQAARKAARAVDPVVQANRRRHLEASA